MEDMVQKLKVWEFRSGEVWNSTTIWWDLWKKQSKKAGSCNASSLSSKLERDTTLFHKQLPWDERYSV